MKKRSKKVARIWPYEDCSIAEFQELIFNLWFNALSANFTKWSNTFKQFVGKLSTNCLSVFDHFVGLALKGLTSEIWFEGDSTTTKTTSIRAISIRKSTTGWGNSLNLGHFWYHLVLKIWNIFPEKRKNSHSISAESILLFLVLSLFYLISTRITINLLMTINLLLVDLIYRTLQYYELLGYLERLKIDKK